MEDDQKKDLLNNLEALNYCIKSELYNISVDVCKDLLEKLSKINGSECNIAALQVP